MAHTNVIDPNTGRVLRVNIVHASHAHVVLFLFFNMWPTFLGLPLLLAIITLSKTIRRHATFINQCVMYILIGLSSSLLLFSRNVTGPEPDPMLCLFQASLVYGMPPMASTATCMLVLQMFFKFRAAHNGKPYEDAKHRGRLWAMVICPYVAYFITILATAIVGANDANRVSRSRRVFYCSVESDTLTNTLTSYSAVVLLVTIVFEVWSIVLLVRHRKVVKDRGGSLRGLGVLDFSFSVRILAFGLYIVTAMSLCLLSVTSPASPVPDLVVASGATVIILIFGTQADILNALCFWRNYQWSPWWKPAPPVELEPSLIDIDLKHAFDPESTYAPPCPNAKKKTRSLSDTTDSTTH
ncbi:hypothetical protein FA15DRAFT_282411 [Coprinopsis marcescibilis]|uniref:G-protein coupled receptors family 1 profile domain-containing protein n=1 Tax=Coprinopsis marcescibilis TaxID=230819 RepID=A0A5C3L9T4_COPMA|nr:hypothetical protein FA15DRAFT_282411 [Coprinopsis marcescibilis]